MTYDVPDCVNSLSYSNSGQLLAAGFVDHYVRVYSVY